VIAVAARLLLGRAHAEVRCMRDMETEMAEGPRNRDENGDSSLRSQLDAAQRAEVDATRANDSKTIFLRMASHELRTPLQALHLQLTRFERMNPERSQEGDKVLQGMKRSARRLNVAVMVAGSARRCAI
jgi:signal transduction histidine kinase